MRDKHGFEYADERCIELAKKIKTLIDDTAVYADWLSMSICSIYIIHVSYNSLPVQELSGRLLLF